MENLVTLQLRAGTKNGTKPRMKQKEQDALTTVVNKCKELDHKINVAKTKAMILEQSHKLY